MSQNDRASVSRQSGRSPTGSVFDREPGRLVELAAWLFLYVGFFTIAYQPLISTDIAWHLLAAREWLHGAELYVDIRDPNLPGTWMFFRAVCWLSEVTGVPAHRMLFIIVAIGGVAVGWLTVHLLPATTVADRWRAIATLCGLGAFFGFASLYMSGQRDYDVALALLPYAAWCVRLGTGQRSRRGLGAVATLLALLSLHLKPYYLVSVVLLELWLAWRRRDALSWLRADLLLPALAVLAALAAQYAAFPAFRAYLEAWLPFYVQQPAVAVSDHIYLTLALLVLACLAVVLRPAASGAWARSLVILALSALAACVAQGKWWDYQAYPTQLYAELAWCLLALDLWLARRLLLGWRRYLAVAMGTLVFAWFAWVAAGTVQLQKFHTLDRPPNVLWTAMTEALDAMAADRPVALFGRHDATVAVYQSHARWGLSDISMWVDGYVDLFQTEGLPLPPFLQEAAARHLQDVAIRLQRDLPELIAFYAGTAERPAAYETFYRSAPAIDALLGQHYEPVDPVAGYRLFRRVH